MVKKINQQNNLHIKSIKELISNNRDANIRINIKKAEEKAKKNRDQEREDVAQNNIFIDEKYSFI